MRIQVSDHAVIRYLERVLKLDIEEFKKKILPERAKEVYRSLKSRNLTYNCGEFKAVIKDSIVVTIMTKDKKYEMAHRKKNYKRPRTFDKCSIYWWLAFNSNGLINLLAFKASGWKMSQQITWVKESMVFSRGQDFHRMTEPCFFGWKQGESHFSVKKIANLKDVFNLNFEDFMMLPDIWFEHRDNTSEYHHPTQKPIKLAERALKKNSMIGHIVIDAFGGSGSTLMACEQMDRKARLIEMDPKFCDVIIKRWEQYTGDKAIKLN